MAAAYTVLELQRLDGEPKLFGIFAVERPCIRLGRREGALEDRREEPVSGSTSAQPVPLPPPPSPMAAAAHGKDPAVPEYAMRSRLSLRAWWVTYLDGHGATEVAKGVRVQ